MTLPPKWENAVVCFCGHGLFDHDNYGPCEKCVPPGGPCEAFTGCLVVGSGAGKSDSTQEAGE